MSYKTLVKSLNYGHRPSEPSQPPPRLLSAGESNRLWPTSYRAMSARVTLRLLSRPQENNYFSTIRLLSFFREKKEPTTRSTESSFHQSIIFTCKQYIRTLRLPQDARHPSLPASPRASKADSCSLSAFVPSSYKCFGWDKKRLRCSELCPQSQGNSNERDKIFHQSGALNIWQQRGHARSERLRRNKVIFLNRYVFSFSASNLQINHQGPSYNDSAL